MTELLAQHGAAKGSKITDGINNDELFGVIFSQNDEKTDSIEKYYDNSDFLKYDNTLIDPQFYYSTFEKSVLKNLGDIKEFPSNITRRDWRKKIRNH